MGLWVSKGRLLRAHSILFTTFVVVSKLIAGDLRSPNSIICCCPHLKLLFCNFSCTSHQTASSLAFILAQCRTLKSLQQVHAYLLTTSHTFNIFLFNNLINSYFSFGHPLFACQVFQEMHVKNRFTWTMMVSGYAQNRLYSNVVDVFSKMIQKGFFPNPITYVSVLPACAHLGILKLGRTIHGCLIRQTFELNVRVQTALMDMYSKCGYVTDALALFDKIGVKNIVSWNSIISCYANNGSGVDAFQFFNLMRIEGMDGDHMTAMALLSACSDVECLRLGHMVRSWLFKSGFEDDVLLITELVNMYLKCGSLEEAYRIFRVKKLKDIVTWTLMIWGFMANGQGGMSLELFNELMYAKDVVVDHIAVVGALLSCAGMGNLMQGRLIHGMAVKLGFESNIFLGSSGINMYACCGDLESSVKCFDEMVEKDIVCWNAMIAGYGMNGNGKNALNLFFQMQELGINPNETTFVCLLNACTHSGLVRNGIKIYISMGKRWGVKPNSTHYACLVDLLGRAGCLEDAYLFVKDMESKPDASLYCALLPACRNHGNVRLGLDVSNELSKLSVMDPGYSALFSSIYAMNGTGTLSRKLNIFGVRRKLQHSVTFPCPKTIA